MGGLEGGQDIQLEEKHPIFFARKRFTHKKQHAQM